MRFIVTSKVQSQTGLYTNTPEKYRNATYPQPPRYFPYKDLKPHFKTCKHHNHTHTPNSRS